MSCGAIIDSSRTYSLCDECMDAFKWNIGDTCEVCGKSLGKKSEHRKRKICYDCQGTHHYFDKGFSCFGYGSREKAPIIALKYGEAGYLGKILGDIAYDRIMLEIEKLGGEIFFDYIVPVPIHKERLATRGYNQAELVGRRLSKRLGIPQLNNCLGRAKNTRKMNGLDSIDRVSNVEGAFFVTKEGKRILGEQGKNLDFPSNAKADEGVRILLLDDIYTTGATADEAAKTLKEAGASKVFLLSLASGSNYYRQK